jgi:hypothetical protein
VNPDEKLALIVRSLRDNEIDALVMGGHAVRYYGVDRNTSDFDLVTSVFSPDDLINRIPTIPLFVAIREIPVWRSGDFARFEIGKLPDGRPELLEFWIHNHLLPDFATLKARAETGRYGGDDVAFISLQDLIRSKETERESDWQDIALLEEIQDARLLARAPSPNGIDRALENVCSRRGLERLDSSGLLDDAASIGRAIENCTHPVTFAMLSPLSPESKPKKLAFPIESTSLKALAHAAFKSALHWGVVEVIRRGYKRQAMEMDRRDKQAKVNERNH